MTSCWRRSHLWALSGLAIKSRQTSSVQASTAVRLNCEQSVKLEGMPETNSSAPAHCS